jgi:hypothetical protein
MKKLLFLTLATIIVACSNEEVKTEPIKCNCEKIGRTQLLSYNPSTGKTTAGDWVIKSRQSNFTNDCSQDGRNYIQSSQSNSDGTKTLNTGYVIQCK